MIFSGKWRCSIDAIWRLSPGRRDRYGPRPRVEGVALGREVLAVGRDPAVAHLGSAHPGRALHDAPVREFYSDAPTGSIQLALTRGTPTGEPEIPVPQAVPLVDTVPKRAGSSYGRSVPRDYAHTPLKIKRAFIVGDQMNLSNRSGQFAAMPTIGWFRWVPPIEPSKPALPKAKTPPSEATSQ